VTARAYPLPQSDGDDPRFCFGLIHDVGKVLESHGFPPVKGTDAVDLMAALFRFVYATDGRPVPDEASS